MTPGGTYTVVHHFDTHVYTVPGGVYLPGPTLIQANDGNFYGTTRGRGPFDDGTVFKLTSTGTFTTLSLLPHPGSDAPLIQASDGNFYGTTAVGLASRVFQMTPGGTVTAVQDLPESGAPYVTALIQATDGRFYGTTGTGAIFRLSVTAQAATITGQPSAQTVTAGRPASFEVLANGFPPASYQWQLSTDHGGSWMNVIDAGRFSGANKVEPDRRGYDAVPQRLPVSSRGHQQFRICDQRRSRAHRSAKSRLRPGWRRQGRPGELLSVCRRLDQPEHLEPVPG